MSRFLASQLIVLNPELLVKGSRQDALITTHARIPLIVVSSGPAAIGAVDALDAGADDYLRKPYNPRELAARIRAVLRGYAARHVACRYLRVGDLELNTRTRRLRVHRWIVELGRHEFDVVRVLAERPGILVPYSELTESIWGSTSISKRTLDSAVAQVRRQLLHSASHIHVMQGVGLRLDPVCPCGNVRHVA